MKNVIQDFFDKRAAKWDEEETCPIERKKALLDRLGIKRGDKVIDIACGTGVITGLLHEITGENVLAVDLSEKMTEIARKKYKDNKNIAFRQCDFVTDEIDGKFDYAVIYNAYPHFIDVDKLSAKLSKILKEDGEFAVVHSLSREQLNAHHAGEASSVSRTLRPPKEEAASYVDRFIPVLTEEGDDYYLLVFSKK